MPQKLWWTTFPYIFVDLQDHLHTCMHGGLVDLVHWNEKATLIWKTMAPALHGCHQIGTSPGSRPAACSPEQWANCSEPWQMIWWSLATNSVSFHRLIMAVRFIILCKDRTLYYEHILVEHGRNEKYAAKRLSLVSQKVPSRWIVSRGLRALCRDRTLPRDPSWEGEKIM